MMKRVEEKRSELRQKRRDIEETLAELVIRRKRAALSGSLSWALIPEVSLTGFVKTNLLDFLHLRIGLRISLSR